MNIETGEYFYHQRRAAEELIAALDAIDPQVREAHATLARLHERAVRRRERPEPASKPVGPERKPEGL